MNKKKVIIISAILLVLILIILLVVFRKKTDSTIIDVNSGLVGKTTEKNVPSFLTSAEKAKLKIPDDKKIQAITRDENGEVTVYKIINKDSDVVDPSQIKPIRSK